MISIKEKSNNKVVLIVDGQAIKSETFDAKNDVDLYEKYYELFIKKNNIIDKIGKYSLNDFPPLYFLTFPITIDWVSNGLKPRIWFMAQASSKNNREKIFKLSLDFSPRLVEWQGNYTIAQYYRELKKIISNSKMQKIELHDREGGIGYGFQIVKKEQISSNTPLEVLVFDFIEVIKKLHLQTEKNILAFSPNKLVNVLFQFPENLKIPCEQYLLYFAQFLQDLGINATSNLKEEAGKVLFSVTPTDDVEALDKIRKALAVYLKLPESPIIFDDSFKSMRTQQQIENLQHSQRMMVREIQVNEKLLIAQSDMIREKNTTISQQQITIDQQNKIIEKISSKSIMMDSLENKEEFEKVFDGLEFGESKELKEKLGIKFNPVTSLKSLGKKLIGKDDEITSLNLDENEE